MTADSFRARIKPFMLRRMKNDVLNELPEKNREHNVCGAYG